MSRNRNDDPNNVNYQDGQSNGVIATPTTAPAVPPRDAGGVSPATAVPTRDTGGVSPASLSWTPSTFQNARGLAEFGMQVPPTTPITPGAVVQPIPVTEIPTGGVVQTPENLNRERTAREIHGRRGIEDNNSPLFDLLPPPSPR